MFLLKRVATFELFKRKDMYLIILIIDVATKSEVYYAEDITEMGSYNGALRCYRLANRIYDDMEVALIESEYPLPEISIGLRDIETNLNLYFNLINIWYDEQF